MRSLSKAKENLSNPFPFVKPPSMHPYILFFYLIGYISRKIKCVSNKKGNCNFFLEKGNILNFAII